MRFSRPRTETASRTTGSTRRVRSYRGSGNKAASLGRAATWTERRLMSALSNRLQSVNSPRVEESLPPVDSPGGEARVVTGNSAQLPPGV